MISDFIFLLIEDNEIDQLVTVRMLKKVFGVTNVHITSNGKEATQWLYDNRLSFKEPMIILLDIQMPVMDGFEFLKNYGSLPDAIKQKNQIFMLSSTLDPDDITRVKSNPYVSGFLRKPFPIDELGKLI